MRLLKVGAASVNTTPLDWDGNSKAILSAVESAKERGVQLLLMPELVISGYGCEDFFNANGTLEAVECELEKIKEKSQGIALAVGLPFHYRNTLFNGVALVVDQKICGIVAKQNLANDGIHYESRWFQKWTPGDSGEVTICGDKVPVGDLIFTVDGVRIGFEICEDAWVAQRPGRALVEQGVDVILNPSASHFSFGKHEVRKRFVLDGSRAFGVTYIYANLLGNEAGRVIYDGGNMIASKGELLCESERFGYDDMVLVDTIVDLTTFIGKSKVNGDKTQSREVAVPYSFQWEENFQPPLVEEKIIGRYEEFAYAVTLGLFDYIRKSWSRGVMLSLSGGADSTACAVIVWLICQRGMKENRALFEKKLAYMLKGKSVDEYMSVLLCTLYQSTKNSGPVTFDAAKSVAEALGAEFHDWSVEDTHSSYKEKVKEVIGREPSWEQDDIAMQNIQARVRVPGLWMLANIKGSLLVSTSNRSEAAVGYATMDGDTSGGLSPLAGIDKAFLIEWLRWMETEGIEGIGPLPVLKKVTDQQPTAELRPQEAAQTDEADLMPYRVLEQIEKLAIRDKRYPMEVFRLLGAIFPNFTEKTRAEWVLRFFRLWARNQWKRERYAPSFHFDDLNLDPRSFCRFPILSGGFRRELMQIENRYLKGE